MKANGKIKITAATRKYFAAQGKKGGESKSLSKVQAVRANLEKARAKRWPKKKAAA